MKFSSIPDSAKNILRYEALAGEIFWISTGLRAGTMTCHGYRRIIINGKQYPEHRVAWFLQTGVQPSQGIDHINRNRGDNRWVNLRLASHAENGMNRGAQKNNRTGLKGVSPAGERWRAVCKRKYLGCFDTPEQAYAAYQYASGVPV